jgi:chromosome partitioning protein
MRWVVFNKKGGVGKTSIVCNLAAAAAATGRRTLVVDLDPQADTTRYLLGAAAAEVTPTLFDFFQGSLGFSLFGERAVETFVHPTGLERLALVPSHRELGSLEDKLQARYKILKLRDALAKLDYDEVFLDTPPALGFFTMSALCAAERCLIPFDCDDFSRHALYVLQGHVREVAADHNPALAVAGVVVNQFDSRARLPQQLVDELEAEGFRLLRPFLSPSVKLRESHQAGQPLVSLAPRHKLAEQFAGLWENLAASEPTTRKRSRQGSQR